MSAIAQCCGRYCVISIV